MWWRHGRELLDGGGVWLAYFTSKRGSVLPCLKEEEGRNGTEGERGGAGLEGIRRRDG